VLVTWNYFWLLRVVYSSTGVEWPREEATAGADTNRKQQLCVSHSSPWMTTAMRASACQKDSENASSWLHLSMPPRYTYSAEHMVSVCRYTPTPVTMKPLLPGPHTEGLHIYTVKTMSKCQLH